MSERLVSIHEDLQESRVSMTHWQMLWKPSLHFTLHHFWHLCFFYFETFIFHSALPTPSVPFPVVPFPRLRNARQRCWDPCKVRIRRFHATEGGQGLIKLGLRGGPVIFTAMHGIGTTPCEVVWLHQWHQLVLLIVLFLSVHVHMVVIGSTKFK